MRAIWVWLLAGCTLAAPPDAKKLTARELFYSAVDTPAAGAKPAKTAAKPKPPSHTKAPASGPNLAGNSTTGQISIPVVNAAYRPQGPHPALGLGYTILKK